MNQARATGGAPWPVPRLTACRPPCQTVRASRSVSARLSPEARAAPPSRARRVCVPVSRRMGPAAARNTRAGVQHALSTVLPSAQARGRALTWPAGKGAGAQLGCATPCATAGKSVRGAVLGTRRATAAPEWVEAPNRWTAWRGVQPTRHGTGPDTQAPVHAALPTRRSLRS